MELQYCTNIFQNCNLFLRHYHHNVVVAFFKKINNKSPFFKELLGWETKNL